MDKFDSKTRSRIMRSIKSKGNKTTEIALIKVFKKNCITGWRRNVSLFGKPDFYFPKFKTVVFADGCFWHGCRCHELRPKTNRIYWIKKIENNKKRDKKTSRQLRKIGYTVIRIKECQIKRGFLPKILFDKILQGGCGIDLSSPKKIVQFKSGT